MAKRGKKREKKDSGSNSDEEWLLPNSGGEKDGTKGKEDRKTDRLLKEGASVNSSSWERLEKTGVTPTKND